MKKLNILAAAIFLLPAITAVASPQNDHYPQYVEEGNRALDGEKYDLAIEYYNSAIDDNSDCWQAYVGLGNCYYYQKKYKESLKNYEKALKMDPDNSELIKFVQFLRAKVGTSTVPAPTPTVVSQALPSGFPALPPPGSTLPPPK